MPQSCLLLYPAPAPYRPPACLPKQQRRTVHLRSLGLAPRRPTSAKSLPHLPLTALWTLGGANISKTKFFRKKKKRKKEFKKRISTLHDFRDYFCFYTPEVDSPFPFPKRTGPPRTCPSLSSVSSPVPLGGEGLLGGLPLICHHQKERTKPRAPGAGAPARLHRTDGQTGLSW